MNDTRAQLSNAIATMFIEPSFKLFRSIDVINVNVSCEAPKRAEAVPDSALKGANANVVVVGNSNPNGSTKKNKGISCI